MNFIQDGLNWFQQQRKQHTTVQVKVGETTPDKAVTKDATVTLSNSSSIRAGVKAHVKYFHFIFDKSEMSDVQVSRNLKIWYNGNTFQVASEGRVQEEYNDPMMNDIIITTVLAETNETR